MASNLFWFYDALAAGILLVAMYLGARRGLMKTVVLVVLTVLSILASWFAAEIASPVIYDSLIKEHVVSGLSNTSEEADPIKSTSEAVSEADLGVEISDNDINRLLGIDGDFFANLAGELKNNGAAEDEGDIQTEMKDSVTNKMLTTLLDGWVAPETISEILTSLQGTTDSITDVLTVFLSGDMSATASAFEETVIAPAIKGLLRVLIFVVLLLILRLIIGPVSELFKNVNKIPIIGPVNALCGGLLGIIEGAVVVVAIALLVRLAVYLNENSLMFLNVETVDKTYLFKYFYHLDLTAFGKF